MSHQRAFEKMFLEVYFFSFKNSYNYPNAVISKLTMRRIPLGFTSCLILERNQSHSAPQSLPLWLSHYTSPKLCHMPRCLTFHFYNRYCRLYKHISLLNLITLCSFSMCFFFFNLSSNNNNNKNSKSKSFPFNYPYLVIKVVFKICNKNYK